MDIKQKKRIELDIIRMVSLHGSTTRRDLVELFGIRPATLYAAVDKLIELGILHEPERRGKKTGRKASIIKFNPAHGCFAGVELRPRELLGAVVDLSGKTVATLKKPIDSCGDNEKLLDFLLEFIDTLMSDSIAFRGVGFADPGIVDFEKQTSILAVNIDNWRNVDVRERIRTHTGIENTLVDSEAVAGAFYEYSMMKPDHPSSFFHMAIGYGVGAAFIDKGRIFRGSTNCGMEIGHLIVDPGGPLCQCGNHGCLEAIVSSTAIQRKVEYLVEQGVSSKLSHGKFSMKSFIDAVNCNDKVALSIATEVSTKIAVALQAVIALVNPQIIMLNGELTGIGDMMLNIIRRHLELNCQPNAIAHVCVRISNLDEFATPSGVALLAREKYLTCEHSVDEWF